MPEVNVLRGIILWCFFWVTPFLLHAPIASEASDSQDAPEFEVIKATPALLEKLRSGGFVLYMRHGRTDPRLPDQVPMDMDDCSTQRPLTDQGRDEIAAVGEAVRRAAFPVPKSLDIMRQGRGFHFDQQAANRCIFHILNRTNISHEFSSGNE